MFMTKNHELLMELKAHVETLKTALIVMDPKVSTSADAYDGLRKQVVMSASSRQAHLVQLAQFSRALRRGADSTHLTSLVDEWMQQAGLVAVTDANPDLYEILDEDPGTGHLVVMTPAYVDPKTGALIAQGQAHWEPHTSRVPAETSPLAPDGTNEVPVEARPATPTADDVPDLPIESSSLDSDEPTEEALT